MLIPISAIRIADATSTAHLDKVERGYENMEHFHVQFMTVGQALRSIDFIQGDGSTESNVPIPEVAFSLILSIPNYRGGRWRRWGGRRRWWRCGPDGFGRQCRYPCIPPTLRAPTDKPFDCHERRFKLAASYNANTSCKRISPLSFISGQLSFLPFRNWETGCCGNLVHFFNINFTIFFTSWITARLAKPFLFFYTCEAASFFATGQDFIVREPLSSRLYWHKMSLSGGF